MCTPRLLHNATTSHRPSLQKRAFTLIEVLVAIALLGTVTSAIVLALAVTLQEGEEVVAREIAMGLARDLMDEILSARYCEPGTSAYSPVLGPSPAELATGNRSLFDDIDDYHNLVDEPPKDKWGQPLGQEEAQGQTRPPQAQAAGLSRFRREVKVQYVSGSNLANPLPAGSVSDYRRIEVTVYLRDGQSRLRPLANLVRVVGHAPTESW